jgi:hypothetical protein
MNMQKKVQRPAFHIMANFLILWILIHTISGLIGFGIEAILLQNEFAFSTIIGIIIIEMSLFTSKTIVYKIIPDYSYIKPLDNYLWLLSGLASFMMSLVSSSNGKLDFFTPTMIIPGMSGILVITICITSLLQGFIQNEKVKKRVMQIKGLFNQAQKIKLLLTIPIGVLIIIILFIICEIVFSIILLFAFAIPIAPIQVLLESINTNDIIITRIIFGMFGVGWISVVTGISYIYMSHSILSLFENKIYNFLFNRKE